MRFHNRVCDRLASGGTPSTMLFGNAREMVVKHYQWMLRSDFLPRIVDSGHRRRRIQAWPQGLRSGATGTPTMLIEFSVAAYRLGHSMIRDKYNWNAVFSTGGALGDRGTLDNLFRFSGTSGTSVLGLSSTTRSTALRTPADQLGRPLDTALRLCDGRHTGTCAGERAVELHPPARHPPHKPVGQPAARLLRWTWHNRAGHERNLAFRNLVRGRMVGLATGQEVAAHIATLVPGVKVLTAAGDPRQ